MGVKGLLGLLKEIQQPTHLKAFRGQTIAIDGYVWLYRGCFACAMELGLGLSTDKFLSFCIGRTQLLLHYQILPYVVFDGADLPIKQSTNESRKKRRDMYREEGKSYMKKGNKKKALECFQRALEVTPEIAFKFIQYLKKENLPFLVAPYEADAQLVYLQKHNLVSTILTEDSDLLVFGATHVLFKLESDGSCQSIQLHDLPKLKTVSFVHWTHDHFIHMCILAGCDYLPSLPTIGLMKAYKYIQRTFTSSTSSFTSLMRVLKMDGHMVPTNYLHQFQLAKYTFLHQRVFCPNSNALTHVTPVSDTCCSILNDNDTFLGPRIPDAIAKDIAYGRLHPVTHAPMTISAVPKLMAPSNTTTTTPSSFNSLTSSSSSHQKQALSHSTTLSSSLVTFGVHKDDLHTKKHDISKSETQSAIQVASGFKKLFTLHAHKPFQFRSKSFDTPPLLPTPVTSDQIMPAFPPSSSTFSSSSPEDSQLKEEAPPLSSCTLRDLDGNTSTTDLVCSTTSVLVADLSTTSSLPSIPVSVRRSSRRAHAPPGTSMLAVKKKRRSASAFMPPLSPPSTQTKRVRRISRTRATTLFDFFQVCSTEK